MRNLLVPAILLLASACQSPATEQVEEQLKIDGVMVPFHGTPLESYFPDDDTKRPRFPLASTACWRGYIGVWEIADGKLTLQSFHKPDHNAKSSLGEKFPMSMVFPDVKDDSPVDAKWFTGTLRIAEGKRLESSFGNYTDRDHYITVEKGKIAVETLVDNRKEGATRSSVDLAWVLGIAKPPEDKGDWADVRQIHAELIAGKFADGTSVTTRGLLYRKGEETTGTLWVQSTPTTRATKLELSKLPKSPAARGIQHVEIVATYDQEGRTFAVSKVRKLEPGETMHHPKFKAPEPKAK